MTVFTLPPLPYADDALEPAMSARTLQFHHGKHHKAYVEKANALIVGSAYERLAPADIIRKAKADGDTKVFNQAAQAWNHEFLWNSFAADGGGAPAGALKAALDRDLGGLEGFGAAFTKAATEHFASGWAWLVRDGEALKIITTHDADNALTHGVTPLLVLDLWEHAYYLDYQNARPEFVEAFLGKLINWEFAAANYGEGERLAA